jgi:hypothetical protein
MRVPINARVLGPLSILFSLVGPTHADTITASFNYTNANSVNITRASTTMDLTTVMFAWTRQDSPGPGVDSTIPVSFPTYCVDIDQHVGANTNYTYQVETFAQAGFSSTAELLLDRMWALYQPGLSNATDSAAFQVAVWELTYDSGADLAMGNFIANGPGAVVSLAQTYLNAVSIPSYSGPAASLEVLHSETAQDQITPVPAPAGGAALGLLCLVRCRRRR